MRCRIDPPGHHPIPPAAPHTQPRPPAAALQPHPAAERSGSAAQRTPPATAAAFCEAAAAFDVITNSWGFPTAFTDDGASSIFRNVLDAMKFAAGTGCGGFGTVSVWSGGNYRSPGDDVNAHNLKEQHPHHAGGGDHR